MNLTYQGQILLEIRRRYGAGLILVASENTVLEEFRREVCSDEPDLRKLSRIALKDAGLIARLAEIANASLRYRAIKPVSTLQAVNRLGISGCKAVIFNYIVMQANLNLKPSWRRVSASINQNLVDVTARIYQAAEQANNRKLAADAFDIAIMFALSCFAKIIASNHVGIPCNQETASYVRQPDIFLMKIMAQQLGYDQEFLTLLEEQPLVEGTDNAFLIAVESWLHVLGSIPERGGANTLKFKH